MTRRKEILKSERGLTLVELLISITIIALIAGVSTRMIGGTLDSWQHNRGKEDLLNTARLAMERMVSRVRSTTSVLLPLKISDPTDPLYPASSYYPRNVMAVSGNIDNDGDGLADEDPGSDRTGDGQAGIMMIDDDNDGTVDEDTADNDDEDSAGDEDVVDGVDNDGDGAFDEDAGVRFYGTSSDDDDVDGALNEDPFDPVIYYLSGTTLMERQNVLNVTTADKIVAENVAQFMVLRRQVNGNTLIDIFLQLDNGTDSVELVTTTVARAMFKP